MISEVQSKSPLISVIITTYNSAETLPTLFKSIKVQTYKKLEIIVVDNHSDDKTVGVSKQYTRKIWSWGPERSAQRNFGVSKSDGKYILILDSDMELQKNVISECVELAEKEQIKAIIIPERTVGQGFIQNIRKFEREMYEGDLTIELARFYSKKIFLEVGGFDERLTGPEDYDLFYRVSKKTKIGRINSYNSSKARISSSAYILHHEEGLTLTKLLQKKFYYANKGALYAEKHPELIKLQGTIIFRKSYLKNWKKFIQHPMTGLLFLGVRSLETIWAVAGFVSAVGLANFLKKLPSVFRP